jgi:hypothetical protein
MSRRMTLLLSQAGAGVRLVIVYSDSASNTARFSLPQRKPEKGHIQLATKLMTLIFQDTESACHLTATTVQKQAATQRGMAVRALLCAAAAADNDAANSHRS